MGAYSIVASASVSGSGLSSSTIASRCPPRLDVGAHGLEVDRQAQVGRRPAEAGHVVVERERPAAVEAHDLEDAVAAQEPVVGGGDLRL